MLSAQHAPCKKKTKKKTVMCFYFICFVKKIHLINLNSCRLSRRHWALFSQETGRAVKQCNTEIQADNSLDSWIFSFLQNAKPFKKEMILLGLPNSIQSSRTLLSWCWCLWTWLECRHSKYKCYLKRIWKCDPLHIFPPVVSQRGWDSTTLDWCFRFLTKSQ